MIRVVRGVALVVGVTAWVAYLGRLLLRALHMLQLEGYQSARFLHWSTKKAERWARSDRAALAVVAGAIGLAGRSAPGGRPAFAAAVWAVIGAWLLRGATFGAAKKPLVLTPRARRLLAGEAFIASVAAIGPAAWLAIRGRPDAGAGLCVGISAASLLVPTIAAGANVLLWPIEEGFRRYYLRDAKRRLRACGPTVIGVAGSYGKTSTKEFIAAILGRQRRVLKAPGSYNTPMGLCRVIREHLEPGHELFVAELGDWVPGDIRFLCELVDPKIGVLTTIGPEHLERFRTLDRVVQSKAELIDALPPDGVAVVNQDDSLVRGLGERASARGLRVVRYGLGDDADVQARDVQTTRDGLRFVVDAQGHGVAELRVGVLGRHNVSNLLAAAAVALQLGMSLEDIAEAASTIEPVEHRLQPIRGTGGVLVIDDAFNANPRGAAEALDVLAELGTGPDGGRRILVTPGMIELAEREWDENKAFGRKAGEVCDVVILVGPKRARPILAGLRVAGFPADQTHVVRNLAEATERLQGLVRSGDAVLFENDLPDTYDENGTTDSLAMPPTETVEGERPTGSVIVDGLRVTYREEGAETGRTPVVVLHGWGASSGAVVSIQRCLGGERRTVAPDLPGFGASDLPPEIWGTADYAAAVRAFLREVKIERASFVGHSRGGGIAIFLAATAPELVDKLVLVDSVGIRAHRGPGYRARVLAFKAARRVVASRWTRRIQPLQEWFERRFGSADYRQAGAMRGTLVRLVNEDLRVLLPRIQAPTLLIWGDQDEDTPISDGRQMEEQIPDAGLVVFPGAGHFSYADDPGRFCRVVDHFLKN